MKKLLTILLVLSCILPRNSFAQQRIDASFTFQSVNKLYSLYIPSGYNANTPHKLMLGLHPFNTSRWDGMSWCDTLVVFAEMNNLILVCPDGGVDGKIDDPIDTAFTTALLDSMELWYNIDADKMYVMGFSWGGKTVYSYGLYHYSRFGGFLPIGSAAGNTSEVNSILGNAQGMPVYIVHGQNDSPNSRFYPIRDSLTDNNAILNWILMPGIGHTIDFPNRNQILSVAYQWIDSVNCAVITTGPELTPATSWSVYPNPTNGEFEVESLGFEVGEVQVFDLLGNLVLRTEESEIDLSSYPSGIYFVKVGENMEKLVLSK